MKMTAAVVAACALAGLVGCTERVVVRERRPRPVPPPAPTVVETTVPVAPGVVLEEVEVVEAPVAPPPVRVEVRPVAPNSTSVWIEGHWVYTKGGQWRWSSGHWSAPERGYHHYVSGHWEGRGAIQVWVPGHWK